MNDKDDDEPKPPLAHWAEIVQPATLATKPGAERFIVSIKLAERTPKTAASFMSELKDALRTEIKATPGCRLNARFVLVDGERIRLQRATASFRTFNEASTCFSFLAMLGLKINAISAELEDFGENKYDPWLEKVSQSWWPWLAATIRPAPEMPMMKITSRLDLTAGSKYKEGASGKMGKSEDVDRHDAPPPPEEETPEADKPRKKKKKRKEKIKEEDETDAPPE